MEKDLVSIIIPNYNSQKTIKYCLDAIYKQDYENYEVIVVDDCSTDKSVEIIKTYPCKLVSTPKNLKVAAARNLGVKYSKGKILFFVDSDVQLHPDAVSNLVKEFEKDPRIGCVCGMYEKVPLIRDSIFEEYRTLQNHFWQKSSEGFVTPGNFALGAIKADVFRKIGPFNTKRTQSEEVEYGHRLNQEYKLLYTSSVMGVHDHDDKLSVILKKLFERARQRIPLYMKRKKFMKGFETGSRAFGILFAFLSIPTMLLFVVDPVFLLLAAILFIGFLLTDLGQYLFVLREKGVFFTLFFIFTHYIVSVNTGLGLVKGMIDYIFDRQFREI
ncbi:MAG: glycosyltransferase family 2 protein [Clostridiaceae bacterium]|jgi:glycosyltransferase involved in cell wall biosynthesis|nr:glycosyltransferase family 2 protein [Clostridiaceae bacterium]